MSDFLLDFRDLETRRQGMLVAASALKFCEDTQVRALNGDGFSLAIARVDAFDLWGPYEWYSSQGKGMVALAGRIALDEQQWEAARKVDGVGGLACKAIFNLYRQSGTAGLETLNGNFVALLHDPRDHNLHLVTDRCGMCLVYAREGADKPLVYATHPDVLAAALGESQNWDMTSLAEFLMTSRLTFPYTYYRNLRALEPGHIHTFSLQNGAAAFGPCRQYFDFDFKIDPRASEWDLAEELASGLKRAVRRRTLPFLGRVGVGLSGGLDSRALLAAAGSHEQIQAFTLFDEENAELKVARSIAEVCDVKFAPIKRDFEYYGASAELGVRISGGTGPFTCNHYLGARERLKELGLQSILTGCYCDYLLKGLALNTQEGRFSRLQKLAGFKLEFYDSITWFDSPSRASVMARLKARFPEAENARLSDLEWLNVEHKRAFPLAYEEDLAQRVIPQRVLPWYLPIVDTDIINTYLRIPPHFKLNSSLFRKMLTLLCSEKLCRIPDNNTGAPINASWPTQTLHRYWSAFRDRLDGKLGDGMATRGSWPNLRHYFRNSKLIDALWARPSPVAREVFTKILGKNPFDKSISDHAEANLALAFNLLTQKLWLDQRM